MTVRNAGRSRDRSYVPKDSHSCSTCAHSATGPAVQGSANVLINNRQALRVGDKGRHAACCGSNRWEALEGAPRVLINGRLAHRRCDTDMHCGGLGATIDGSPDVLIGDHSDPGRPRWEDVGFRVVDGVERPVAGAAVVIHGPDGFRVDAMTDHEGRVVLRRVRPGSYRLEMAGTVLASKDLRRLS